MGGDCAMCGAEAGEEHTDSCSHWGRVSMRCALCGQEMDPDAAELGLYCADCRAEFHLGETQEEYNARWGLPPAGEQREGGEG